MSKSPRPILVSTVLLCNFPSSGIKADRVRGNLSADCHKSVVSEFSEPEKRNGNLRVGEAFSCRKN